MQKYFRGVLHDQELEHVSALCGAEKSSRWFATIELKKKILSMVCFLQSLFSTKPIDVYSLSGYFSHRTMIVHVIKNKIPKKQKP